MNSKKISNIYFPATIPHHRRAAAWRCIRGYGAMRTERGCGGIVINRCRFPAPHPGAAGKKIFCFSDLHCHAGNEKTTGTLLRLIQMTEPDYIATVGDLVGDGGEISLLEKALDQFSRLPVPKLAIPGNWERGKFWIPPERWREMFLRRGWFWLCNDSFRDEYFYFYGTDDLAQGNPKLPEYPELDGRTAILLAHRPDTVIALDTETRLGLFDFILCGHTHGGQLRTPLFGAFYASSHYGTRFAAGIFQRPGLNSKMIVNTGVGELTFPFRVLCRREVLLLEFESPSASRS